MNSRESSNISRHFLAYFSHSYRPEEKEFNLFFWELLSEHKLYFTVDSKEKSLEKPTPMDITYLEWMMRRSVCFVAVIPYRENLPPYNCSPYQVFENSLALRARKPRLIFVEERLDKTIFGAQGSEEEVCFFKRQPMLLYEDKDKFAELAHRMAQRVRIFAPPDSSGRNPVALLVDTKANTRDEASYSPDTINRIRKKVREQGVMFKTINPNDFEQDFLFLREIERAGVLISEVRQPYIRPDVLGLVHSQCIPTIYICHIKDGEDPEKLKAAMHLSLYEDKWIEQYRWDLPIIFSKYQIDDDMEPVIFWKHREDLGEKISERLKKISEKRIDLITEQQARRYFLRIGRKNEQVFISNASTQNKFAMKLRSALKQEAVTIFHYKEEDAIKIGSTWYPVVMKKINNSAILIALVDSAYLESRWCMRELQKAMLLSKKGKIKIYAYLLDEKAVQVPKHLTDTQKTTDMAQKAEFDEKTYQNLVEDFYKMQLKPMENKSEDPSEKIKLIVKHSVDFLETGAQVNLEFKDRGRIVDLLAGLPSFASQDERKMLLQDAGLPEEFTENVRIKTQESEIAATEIVDDLAEFKDEIEDKSGVKALGLFLSHLMGLIDSNKDKMFLRDIIRYYELMPEDLLPKEEVFSDKTMLLTKKREEEASVTESAQIFLSYASEDQEEVENLYQKLSEAGYKPWMDAKDLVGGEDQDIAINRAIQESDFFLVCLSATSVKQRSYLQSQLQEALRLSKEKLETDIYLIPVRLEEDCEVPDNLRKIRKVDWFEKDGWIQLENAIRVGIERRNK